MNNRKNYQFRFSRGEKKFVLKNIDMKVLAYLYDRKFLTSQQITHLYSFFRGEKLTLENVQMKLRRLSVHGGILYKRIEQKYNSSHKRAFYTLRENGISFLQEYDFLPQSYSYKHTNRFSLHTVTSREVTTRTLDALVGRINAEQHSSLVNDIDIRSFLTQKSIRFEHNPYKFVPDECISLRERIAFIEVDMATEGMEQLLEKVEHYISYAEQTNEDVGVFFVCIDGSLFNPVTNSISYGRLSNLLFRMRKYHNKLMTIPNLKIYVSSLQDAGDVIADFLLEEQYDQDYFAESILNPLANRIVGDAIWKFGFADKVAGFKEKVNGGLRRIHRSDKNATRDFYFLYGHENEYRSIAYLDDLVHSRIESEHYLNIPLLVMYPKRNKPRDILLMSDYKDTYLFSPGNEGVVIESDDKLVMRAASSIYPAKRTLHELY